MSENDNGAVLESKIEEKKGGCQFMKDNKVSLFYMRCFKLLFDSNMRFPGYWAQVKPTWCKEQRH